jgi:hypothetical protein
MESASAIWAVKPIARQASASAGTSRLAHTLPLATRTFAVNCDGLRAGRRTHNEPFMR